MKLKYVMIVCLIQLWISSVFGQYVTLGQSCALSGPAKNLGLDMKAGAKAYFKSSGDIKLISMDDKYEPNLCIQNTKALLDTGVQALFGYVGTPTSKVAVPLAMQAKTIYFGAFTGAGFLSNHAKNPYCFNVRASYDMETNAMVRHLFKDLGIKRIAIFVQDDAFGNVGKSGVEKAVAKLAAKGVSVVGEGRYKRNTLAVKSGADQVIASGAEAVILVGAYMPCGTAIKYWKSKGFNVPYINISFVGSNSLAQAVKKDPTNVVISQVVPFPWDASLPIVAEYKRAMGGQKIGFGSLEGYIAAKIMHKAIQNAGSPVNSEGLKSALEKMSAYDIGGLKVSFGPSDHQGLDFTCFTKINRDGSFTLIKSLKEL